MCGLPRVGKSSWIKKNRNGKVVVSLDDIRNEIFGHQFHQPANALVFAMAEAMVTLLLKQNVDVVVDATNITLGLRLKWKFIAESCNAKVTVVWVYAHKDPSKNLEICMEHNEKSLDGEKLPQDVLSRFCLSFEPPMEKWYDLIEYRNIHRKKRSNTK